MAKKRIYEVAKERGLTNAQVMKRLEQAGIPVKAAASTITTEEEERVFGETKERKSAAPAKGKALPSWLNPSASSGPRTTSKAELEAAKEDRAKRAEAAKSAKSKAQDQARALRAQIAAKRAQQTAANEAAKLIADEVQAEETANAEATTLESVVSSEPAATETAPIATEAVETSAAQTETAEVAEAAAEAEVVEKDEPKRIGPKVVKRAPEKPAEPQEPVAKEEPKLPESQVAADAAQSVAVSEAEMRRKAQKMAQARVAELAAKRRAELEKEKIEAEQRKQSEARGEKKKDKKRKGESTSSEPEAEFIGSRRSRVAPRGAETDRGGRGGNSKRRRVVIDSSAGRGRGAQGTGRGRGARKGKKEEVVIDPTVPVTVPAGASVKELSDSLHVGSTDIIKALMQAGEMVTITQTLTAEQIETVGIALEPPREIIVRSAADEDVIPEFEDAPEALEPRAPVVTVMGHVDHGKTSLLDALRQTKVAAGEAGGITQHIGAYQVEVPGEDGEIRKVTFLDTPGHEAFTALRARGAKVTDEAVLVVAADDGVKPQTIEAIDHARAAEVPIIVAINKIDKEGSQPDRVKSELAQHELQPVEWGGDTEIVEVSAKQRTNLDGLIELILLQADVLELTANPNTQASGYIIESKLDPGRGPVATMLINRGTLRVGDAIVAGATHGKVRALLDFRGERIKEAGPAMPVEIIGFDSVPDAGEFCMVVDNERIARERANKRAFRLKAELLAKRQRGLTLDSLFNRIKEGEIQDLNLIVKTDVAGSAEAIEQELGKIQHPEVRVRIIRSAVGAITKDDIMLASASSAILVGFNVRASAEVRSMADREGVDVRAYRVIYKLREEIEAALSGMLSPEEVERSVGEAEVRQVFKASRIGTIAGCMVTSGTIERGAKMRLLRDGAIVYEGEIDTLKRFKDDAKEVAQGFECGISLANYNDLKEGDIVETYVIEEVDRDISSELTSKA